MATWAGMTFRPALVSQTPEWQEYVANTSQTGRFLAGDDLASFIDNSETSTVEVFKAEGWTAQ